MAKVVLIQGSLSKDSRTAIVLKAVGDVLSKIGLEHKTLDLRDLKMEFCDGRPLKDYPEDMQKAYQVLEQADGYVFGMPVYCFSVSGPLKNFIDITAGAMEKKVAGVVCNAGGNRSFMSSADLMNVLAYESHVTSVQPVVYSNYEDFENQTLTGEKVHSKIEEMVEHLAKHLNSKP
jgi:NAD(P)H-dependent FMN reductase